MIKVLSIGDDMLITSGICGEVSSDAQIDLRTQWI